MPVVKRGGAYYVFARWKGVCDIRLSVSDTKAPADEKMRTLELLRDTGHYQVLQAIQRGRVDLGRVNRRVVAWRSLREPRPPLNLTVESLKAPDQQNALGPLVDAFLEHLKRPSAKTRKEGRSFSDATQIRYRQSWDAVFRHLPEGRNTRVDDLTTERWLAVSDCRSAEGRTPSTINRDACAVGAFFTWLAEKRPELQAVRPTLDYLDEPDPGDVDAHIEPDVLAQVIAATADEHYRDLWRSLAGTGLRIGEMLHVQARDVDRRRRLVAVVARPEYRLKTKASARHVPLTDEPLAILTRLAAGKQPTEYVWPGAVRDYNRTSREWELACINAGAIDPDALAKGDRRHGYTLHSLRHLYGVAGVRAGRHIAVVMQLMGHSNLTTAQRYQTPGDKAEALHPDAALIAQAMRPNVVDTASATNAPSGTPPARRSRMKSLA